MTSESHLLGAHTWLGTTKDADSTRMAPCPQLPALKASKFWICALPLSEFTNRQAGRCGSAFTVYM